MDVQCPSCHALHWMAERLTSSSNLRPKFGMCCLSGKITLPPLHQPPPELMQLLTSQDPVSKDFREHIRNYNNALAMTSIGRKVDESINDGEGPYIFRLHGALSHKSGSLLPPEGEPPVFAQLYIYDPADAVNFQMANRWNTQLDHHTMVTLQDMLHRHHPAVQMYKQAHELTRNMPPEQQCKIALRFNESCDRRRYNLPTAATDEIAVILPGDGDQPEGVRDIVLYRRYGPPLQRITDVHPLYPALHYVLLFPTGQLQWFPQIEYTGAAGNEAEDQEGGADGPRRRKCISKSEFYRYRLHPRPPAIEPQHIFLTEKLYQEFICDQWATSEQDRLRFIMLNQNTIRGEVYSGLADAVAANIDASLESLGQRIILPSSFSGSTRQMQQLLQDALAINRFFKGADLFLTMTANPAWPEIQNELLPGQTAADRPDLVVRAFYAKQKQLIKDIEDGIFGKALAYVFVIEFQKRGLPHMHCIIFLDQDAKIRTPEQIDTLLSSEFPVDNPELLELVKKYMVHKPCSAENNNPKAPCLQNGKCSKNFPKPFRDQTTISEDAYASTRRRDTGQTHQVRGKQVDNRWVVTYCAYLIWKYRCHINLESIASIKAIKYIYKYVYKGHDRITMQFGTCNDEVKQYLDARYVSACESIWRLFHFLMHCAFPNVVRLQVHLPGQQYVTWNENGQQTIQEVADNAAERDTTLTGYFKANQQYPELAQNVSYQDFPSKFVWVQRTRKWKPRQRGFAIGRMYYAQPTAGERFYLRLLLTAVKGATSYENLRTFQGIVAPSFREACLARGLLENDQEWQQCLEEARSMATGHQLRNLFVTILRDCAPSDPVQLWNTYWPHICDDLHHRLQQSNLRVNPTDADVQDYGLYLINQLLLLSGKSLAEHWPYMPQVAQDWDADIDNRYIAEQRSYDVEEQAVLAAEHEHRFNPDQAAVFHEILQAVINKTGQTFFLHGPGGTGKTYVYNTLCYRLRSQGKIVICVASSGIAALLLKGGRTSHSCFHIPVQINESSTCSISRGSKLGNLFEIADLIIWDEALMQHRHLHESVDRTLRDVRNSDKPFGGICVVFGGDFHQILPVIEGGTRPQVVGASLQRSILWRNIKILHLKINMRLNTNNPQERDFAKWQLEVGKGGHTDEGSNINLPDHFKCLENTVSSLIDTIYPGIYDPLQHSDEYFSQRVILACRNDDVDDLNHHVLHKFPGQEQVFHSADSILNDGDGELLYPAEYLNSINCSGLPLAHLALKVGSPVMVLRNLNLSGGVCNGSRGILTRIRNRVLEVRLITGDHAGSKIFIPRMQLRPIQGQLPFILSRLQFPVRLCFSMTINKSQGQSVEHVGLDLRSAVFTHGQFYVAVSRVKSVQNIKAIWTSTSDVA
jgi:hypothetical protein